jgi:hypothetical protein
MEMTGMPLGLMKREMEITMKTRQKRLSGRFLQITSRMMMAQMPGAGETTKLQVLILVVQKMEPLLLIREIKATRKPQHLFER